MSDRTAVKPLLKWAGGKRWLVANHSRLFPREFACYREPFLGSGAVFFHLAPQRAVLSDANARLIQCYSAVRKDWKAVWRALRRLQRQHSDEFYYEVRGQEFSDRYLEAAKFIYLNRTCFNGIYRENLKGVFNVPRGTKDSVTFPDDDFRSVAAQLKKSKLFHGDFSSNIREAERGDFVFVDPPYTVRHNNNGFIKYNQRIFSWNDQVRLRDDVRLAAEKGARLLITNANHSSIIQLYKGIGNATMLSRASLISGNAGARGSYTELAICVGYDVGDAWN
ncbi:Dam family site-specific DNA-(adenine-N6)-methyltransferase [Bradyrhizobium jicamae]|uniref:DNA adenine methylase n=1 Tax=Bradyrhizobium jicamae TaxID=280332 RepID=UPI002011AB0C|nr:Dam family site-specific DNA-(adenine-N6)-methyltransferase [Bradyrhizobium jicamae]